MARMPMFGHTLSGHFWANRVENFMGPQESIIYWLAEKNMSYDAYLSFLILWGHLIGKVMVTS